MSATRNAGSATGSAAGNSIWIGAGKGILIGADGEKTGAGKRILTGAEMLVGEKSRRRMNAAVEENVAATLRSEGWGREQEEGKE